MSKVGQPNTNKKSFMTMLLPVIAVMLLSTAALNFIMVSRSNEQHVVQMSNQIANSRADALNAVVGQLRSQQESFGKSPDVIRVLEDNDIAAIESFGDNYLMSFDSAERAYLIPVGAAQEFDLKFAEIDMVSKVEQAQVVPPEAYQIGGKKLVSMATLVSNPASKTNLGTLLVTYTLKPFQTALRQNRDDGQVILQQAFPGSQPLEIVSNGTAGTAEPVSADTLVPNWKIVFKPSDKFSGSKISSARDIALIQGIAIILCAVLLGVFQWRRSHGIAASDSILETPIQIKGARKIDKSDKIDISAPPPSVELADPLFNNTDILDLDDDEEFDIRPSSSAPTVVNRPVTTSAPPPPPAKKEKFVVPATAFRDYDIRGHADKDLTDDIARRIGRAFGSECQAQGQVEIVLAGDGRLSTPRLKAAVQEGLLESGCNVLDIGEVPTPLMYFATQTTMSRSGIMVTASHNGASDNGFKMVINGKTLSGDDIQKIKERIENNEYTTGAGSVEQRDMVSTYIDHIVGDVALAGSYRVVVDCGNGVAGSVAPKLFEELGCEVIPLYCEVDGRFPNHAPDPSAPGSLDDLVARVQADGADLGIALDGDGDRITVVTSSGKIVLPDVLLMLFAKDIVSRNPGTDVIFDVKSTKRLNSLVSSYGGRPVMWKSGHSHIKNKMQETGALIAGELSGHIFIRERWFGFDDGMYAGARLLEIMSIRDQDLDGIFSAFPETSSTPEMRIPIDETQKFSVIRQLSEKGEWGNGKVSKIDGVRVDFAKGWGLVRASNTAAELTLRFEADDDDTLATVQHLFKQQLAMVDKSLKLPF